jgi:hypothetical protein
MVSMWPFLTLFNHIRGAPQVLSMWPSKTKVAEGKWKHVGLAQQKLVFAYQFSRGCWGWWKVQHSLKPHVDWWDGLVRIEGICMECCLNVFRIHPYAWNVVWMCFEYTHMHGMLFECFSNAHICMECCLNVFEHIHMHGIWFECVWIHTYARNVVWMCLNTHTYRRNMVWMCLNTHILHGILFLSSHWPFFHFL